MNLPVDIHTHQAERLPRAILSVEPHTFSPQEGCVYSVGFHPWHTETIPADYTKILETTLLHPQVVAVGETGIDRLRGADIERQIEIFLTHIELSETLHKPLIIHAVRSFDRLLALRKKIQPQQPWIIHGYRNNATTARQLLQAGCDLSFGEQFNPEAVATTPIERLWVESDESTLPIATLYRNIATALGCDTKTLQHSIAQRMQQRFFTP